MVDLTDASWFSLSSVSLNTAATSGAIWFYYVLLATPTPNHESVKNLKRTRTGLWGPPLGKFNPVWALTSNCPHRVHTKPRKAVEAVRLSAVKQ